MKRAFLPSNPGATRWLGFFAAWGVLLHSISASPRTWTNQAGTRIEAELLGVEGDTAVLLMNGKSFRIAVETLSPEDQAYVRDWMPVDPAKASSPATEEDGKERPKKGACMAGRDASWSDRMRSLNAGWFYQWKSEATPGAPAGLEFVPMVFGKPNEIGPSVSSVSQVARTSGYQFLLGFNEPDKTDQANMTVEAALEVWPQLMSAGLPLISPAAANPEGEWMERFMDGVKEKGYRVDFIGVHSYAGPDVGAFLNKLERIHEKFGLPLWITEFAVADWKADTREANMHSTKSVEDFMEAVLPKLDRLKFVHRYAWFPADPQDAHLGPSALFNEDGTLTKLGTIYAEH